MSNYIKVAEENGDRYLSALEKGQENFLKYVAAINQSTPQSAGAMTGMSTLRAFSNAGFEFSERLLGLQKAFAESLVAPAAQRVEPARKSPQASGAGTAKRVRKARRSSTVKATKTAPRGTSGAGQADAAGKPATSPEVRSSKRKPVTRAKAARVSKS